MITQKLVFHIETLHNAETLRNQLNHLSRHRHQRVMHLNFTSSTVALTSLGSNLLKVLQFTPLVGTIQQVELERTRQYCQQSHSLLLIHLVHITMTKNILMTPRICVQDLKLYS